MQIKVFMIPKNHEYINKLKHSLEEAGVCVQILKPFHYSTLTNIVKILFYRVKGYSIIHVHWLYIFPLTIVMKLFYYLCVLLDIKIIWEMHNIVSHQHSKRDLKNSRWFYERSHAVIFHSKSDVARVKEILGVDFKKKHVVIPHGNFNDSYENNISRKEARRILNIPDDKKVILCFGFIRRNRGYRYLIEAMADMHDIIIIIAGEIMDREIYRQLCAYEKERSNIKLFIGWIPNNEIQIYFNACDIVVLPYTNITTSGVIPLAYAFSKPVITSNIGGISDIVNDNTGILVPPANSFALKEAIERIFTIDYASMGRFAREYAGREFDWESNARKIKELYKNITQINN